MPRLIVVGSGIAGLIVAIEASRTHSVTLVTKAELGESNTRYAQGGIAAAVFPDDTVASHIADTLAAGAGLCRPEAVEVLCAEGPARIRDLIRLGVEFDRAGAGAGEAPGAGVGAGAGDGSPVEADAHRDPTDGLARGLEAAHGFPRILHAGGDATGAVVERALVRAVRLTASTVLEDTFVADLLVENGRVAGVHTVSTTGERQVLRAEAVVLASGGAGQLYSHTTNPRVTTGDGVAAAYRAGARLADLEFLQFHPTSMDAPGNFLVSEAVRGEGAVLVDEQGVRFMPQVHPDAELAPRDVVARAIAERMSRQGGRPVFLDATGLAAGELGAGFFAARFPSIFEECRRNGIDPATQPIPVTPAAHYWMGGVETDVWGRTSLPGLFAVGEVACTGVHGANRLASNSLLESVVFAWRAVQALAKGPTSLQAGPAEAIWVPSVGLADGSAGLGFSRDALQQLMWDAVGVHRDGARLTAALAQLDAWAAEQASGAAWAAERASGADRREQAAPFGALEDDNLLLLAQLITRSALARRESRGAHFRSDVPGTDEAQRHHLVTRSEPKVLVSP
ncbi:L-aspartate oxidase [Subtercola boreus]|uniref:L-aspartate oxidase n=1 Tax=Subtercola boreus TaxID=120213 RepID=A0A3E0VNN6_9MICO|nr:L-aspartate oxidase [Subtercola boreus]RFA11219.1 L-aspartate oxidase [Subtercola boreus]